ncbi:MAG: alanine dehydrogenase [Planctomycetes bacterium]|nr:alanine dehydrogenase [Planctomycetota bacterium]
MIIGIPCEVKRDEYRVAVLPVGVQLLTGDGHRVLLQKGAGLGSGYDDASYAQAGATLIDSAAEIYDQAQLVMKVKEPQVEEIALLRPDQIVFCYFHFAGSRQLTQGCLDRGIVAVAYETLSDEQGQLPLLTPMSEVAGKMSIQEGAKCLEKPMMGRGILLGGVAGVEPAKVLIIGAGVVGTNAARVAAGLGASVVIMDINLKRLRYLEETMPPNVTTVYCDPHAVAQHARLSDLVVGAVLIPGAKTPRLINRETVKEMKKGAALVDVCIDQGGCCETSHVTTHSDPVFIVEDVVHYCVANMPGAVGRTSSQALCNATLPYCRELAALGIDDFTSKSPGRAAALNMRRSEVLCTAVADAFQL